MLIFPDVLSGSFIIGAEHGKACCAWGRANAGYYSTTAGSIGFQAGAQSKAMVLLFMTQGALDKFRNSSGWTVGADATVAWWISARMAASTRRSSRWWAS